MQSAGFTDASSETPFQLQELHSELHFLRTSHSIFHTERDVSLLNYEWKAQIAAVEMEKNALKTQLSVMREIVMEKERISQEFREILGELEGNNERISLKNRLISTIKLLEDVKEVNLEPTTRLIQVQNLKLQGELHNLMQENAKLRKQQTNLEAEINRLRKSEEIHVQMEQELAKRTKIWQKLVKSSENQQEISHLQPIPQGEIEQNRSFALENEIKRLRKALSRQQMEQKAGESIVAVLAQYSLRKGESKEPEDVGRLLLQDFRSLTLLQKQHLAEHILSQSHELLRKSQALPPLISPARHGNFSQSHFDPQQISIALKPKPRPLGKMVF